MIKLDLDFKKESISEEIVATCEPAYKLTLLATYNGYLVFTTSKIYWIYNNEIHNVKMLKLNPWCIDYSEIASYKKTGLAGFRITLKDGKDLNFSNVFGKMRKKMTEALESHLSNW